MSWINVVITKYQEIQVTLLKIEISVQMMVCPLPIPFPLYPSPALLLFNVRDVMVEDVFLFLQI